MRKATMVAMWEEGVLEIETGAVTVETLAMVARLTAVSEATGMMVVAKVVTVTVTEVPMAAAMGS